MSHESIIRYYNRLNGNSISIDKLKDFRSRVERHIDSHGSGPNIVDMKGILTRVSKAIKTIIEAGASVVERVELVPIDLQEAKPIPAKVEKPKPAKVEVKKADVKKPISIPAKAKKKTRSVIAEKIIKETPQEVRAKVKSYGEEVMKKTKPATSNRQPETGISASSLAGMEFKTLPFAGKWKDHFGLPSENFSAMVWGKPKQGKTYYAFQFAGHLSQYGNVLYVLSDEGIGYTVKEKIIATGLDKNDKVKFFETRELEQIEKAIKSGSFKFVFIDLISNVKAGEAKLTPNEFHALRKRHPQISFIPVFSSTKAGNFKGEQDWGHDVDVLVDVAEGKAISQGRFGGGSEYEIFPKSKEKSEWQKIGK